MHVLQRPYVLLAITTFTYQFAFAANRAILSNFYVEDLRIRADQMGLLTTVRETPGFLMFAIVALTMRFAPPRLAAVCIAVMGVGFAGYSLAYSFEGVLLPLLVFSTGFHAWYTLNGAFALAVARQGQTGRTLGRLQSIGLAGSLLAMGLTFLLIAQVGYRTWFVVSAVIVLAGVVAIARFPAELVKRSPERIIVRRKYGLYYALNFLEGCRMEVFQAFGIFLLVQHYGIGVQTITLLFAVSMLLNMSLSERVGRLVDTFGERRTMTFSYLALFLVFLGLALVPHRDLAIGLYLIYNVALLFSIGVNTYLKRIAAPEDIRGSLAMGVTTMHISAMVLPPIGGVLWVQYGFQTPFLLGAVFIALSMLVTQRLPRPQRAPAPVAG
ncbi:MAG: MFS transporter [Chloroflexi bacterium]|nr:MFS transporter [Chloroflexota bacterium]